MPAKYIDAFRETSPTTKRLIYIPLCLFFLLTVPALIYGQWKVIAISWAAFFAMAGAIPFGVRGAKTGNRAKLTAGYGLASGAMLTGAAIYLLPAALAHQNIYGGLGIAAGIMCGYAIHIFNHNLSHHTSALDTVVFELGAHALFAGLIIGSVYATMPPLSLLLGLAIVSHKAPAGYAAALRLTGEGKNPYLLLLPSVAVGLVALPVSLAHISMGATTAGVIFGFAAGIFIHLAIDFLPACEPGGKLHQQTDLEMHEHHQLDRYRNWAVLNTFAGGFLIFILWYLTH